MNFKKANVKIVIIGANFAGLKAASNLPRHYLVSVIDPQPFFEFIPNIHEIVSGTKQADALRFSKKNYIENFGHQYIRDEVVSLDPYQKRVKTRQKNTFEYDVCLLSVGGVTASYGIKGVRQYGKTIKSVDACLEIQGIVNDLIKTKRPRSIVIGGGGIEGIEVLGELLKRCPPDNKWRFHLVESQSSVLPSLPPVLDSEIRRICAPLNVDWYTNTRITQIKNDRVLLSSQKEIASDLTLWTSGAEAPLFLYKAGLSPKKGEWVRVDETLQSTAFDSIFVAGDAALFQEPIAKQAYHAIDMGAWAAKNMRRYIESRRLKPFKASKKPFLVSFGSLETFLIAGEWVLAGKVLAGMKEGVYQYVMHQFDPTDRLGATLGTAQRAVAGLQQVVWPNIRSFETLKKFRRLRVLW